MKNLLAGGALALGGIVLGFSFGAGADFSKKAAWWELLGVLATTAAVFVALLVPVVGYVSRKREASIASVQYAIMVARVASRVHFRLAALRAPNDVELAGNSHLSESQRRQIDELFDALSLIDTSKLSVAYPKSYEPIAFALTMLDQTRFLHSVSPHKNLRVTADDLIEEAQKKLIELISILSLPGTPWYSTDR